MHNLHKAIYIDFECLGTDPPEPVLLGILRDTGGQPPFEQVILDAALRSAATTPRSLRYAPLEQAAEALVREADAGDCPLVGWSQFDRNVLLATGLPEPVKEAVRRRYVNALDTARPWKTRLYPGLTIGARAPFNPKNTLDRFAVLAGYGHRETLSAGTPARWIRRVKRAVRTAGLYRAVPASVKSDWRALLTYNRHDCGATRHVWLKATRELTAWQEYARTKYCFDVSARRRICFKVGARSAARDRVLERAGASKWAFITAWNPGSERLPESENARRQVQLAAMLHADGYRCLPGEGIGPDGTWPAEESLFVMAIAEREARRVGRAFGQLAIVAGVAGGPAELVRC
jgi:hypothetical protein